MSHMPSVWIWLGIIACVTLSALFAGLNLAIFSLSQLRLQIEADGGNKDAARVLDLRKNSNQVLATVIWGNVGTNVFLNVAIRLGARRTWCVLLLGGHDHIVRRDRPAGIFLAERFANDGTISAVPDFLARRLVFCG
jgi:CBS domain containing-hemolysin-like protein